jgi:Zn-dependent protease
MLNESERGRESYFSPTPASNQPLDPNAQLRDQLRDAVGDVFFVETEVPGAQATLDPRVTVTYTGRLLTDSENAYNHLDEAFKALDHVPILAENHGRHIITALKGRFIPKPHDWRINAVLLLATILSLLYVGASGEIGILKNPLQILAGWPYALGVMLILGTHELGHYFAARYHKSDVSLPFFIPMPLPGSLGTMGAFIQLREPLRNRRVLLDIGVAGPLAGLIMAIPVLLIGLKTSPVLSSPILSVFMLKATSASYVLEGNSVVYALAKLLVFGHFYPDGMRDVFINQLASAGWTGLLVTGLNLLPIGQLDGGHALYSLIGDRARALFFPVLAIMAILATLYTGWTMWLFLLFFFGRMYATPLDNVTPLDPRRRIVAIGSLILFFLVFMPIPYQLYTIGQ